MGGGRRRWRVRALGAVGGEGWRGGGEANGIQAAARFPGGGGPDLARGGSDLGPVGLRWRGVVEGSRRGEVAAPGWPGAAAEVTWRPPIGRSEVAGGHVRRGWTCPAARGRRWPGLGWIHPRISGEGVFI